MKGSRSAKEKQNRLGPHQWRLGENLSCSVAACVSCAAALLIIHAVRTDARAALFLLQFVNGTARDLMRKSIFHERLVARCAGARTMARGDVLARRPHRPDRCDLSSAAKATPRSARCRRSPAFSGPVVAPQSGKTETRIRSTHAIITDLLRQIAGHDHVEMTLDVGFADLAPFLAAGYEVKVHPTFLLDCRAGPDDELWAGLRDKTKNIIRRARERLTVREIAMRIRFAQLLRGQSRRRRILLRPFAAGRLPLLRPARASNARSSRQWMRMASRMPRCSSSGTTNTSTISSPPGTATWRIPAR